MPPIYAARDGNGNPLPTQQSGRALDYAVAVDAKALEARLFTYLEEFAQAGAQVKGFAPLLLDFPGERDGVPILWCWIEGDPDIMWYHRADCGFAGRRPA
jgi:hypothetical protein